MPYPSFSTVILTLLLLCVYAPEITAHAGKQDKSGGHYDKKTQTYHCHSAACFARHQQAQQTMAKAATKQRSFSNVYSRRDWQHWSDVDNDCQNTRAEVLISSSQTPVTFANNNQCHAIATGKWLDPYTNRIFTQAKQLEIDHRIALAEAHRYGGANWSSAKKEQFANDSFNLVAVQAEANQAKSAHPANEWMPKNIGYWCDYILIREAVVKKYALQFPNKELLFNERIKNQYCPK